MLEVRKEQKLHAFLKISTEIDLGTFSGALLDLLKNFSYFAHNFPTPPIQSDLINFSVADYEFKNNFHILMHVKILLLKFLRDKVLSQTSAHPIKSPSLQ